MKTFAHDAAKRNALMNVTYIHMCIKFQIPMIIIKDYREDKI